MSSNIPSNLEKIIHAVKGEEVRQAIHDSIQECYSQTNGLSDEIKQALLACFQNVLWKGADGLDYYDDLYDALYPPVDLVSISAVYTQSGAVYNTDSLDSLKSDLVVTAHYLDSTTATITTYALSGTLTVGTSTITVSYGGKSTSFNVTVTEYTPLYPLENGTHTFSSNNRTLAVTNGKHFAYTNPSAQTSGVGAYLDLSTVSDNDTSGTAWTNISSKTTPLFTIPANASVTLKVKNITATRLDNGKFSISLVNSGNETAVKTGDVTSLNDITINTTVSEDTPVSCVYCYVKNSFSELEADIELFVNGDWWI